MHCFKLLFVALATSALAVSAQLSPLTNFLNTGFNGTVGAADPSWDVYRFLGNTASSANATGATGLTNFLSYWNAGPQTQLATAENANRFSSAWVEPTAASNSLWLALATNAAGTAIHDPNDGGGYAFVYNLGASLSPIANLDQQVGLSFALRGDNGFSVHLLNNTGGSYQSLAGLLGTTGQNFGASASAASVTYTGTIDASTLLVVLLSNDSLANANPGGILVQNSSVSFSAIPEPSTYAISLGLATLALVLWKRRQRR